MRRRADGQPLVQEVAMRWMQTGNLAEGLEERSSGRMDLLVGDEISSGSLEVLGNGFYIRGWTYWESVWNSAHLRKKELLQPPPPSPSSTSMHPPTRCRLPVTSTSTPCPSPATARARATASSIVLSTPTSAW